MEKIVKIQIKWGKEKLDYDLNVDGTMEDFRAGVYSMTFVPVAKQKLIFKGKTLKDDTVLSSLNIKEKALFMLMGAAEGMSIEEQAKPEKQAVFLEDLTPQQIAEMYKQKTGFELPVGLFNLGNTCYMNSCLQCLRRINELKDYMLKNNIPNQMSKEHVVTSAYNKLIRQMNSAGDAVKPEQFVQALFNAFPQFAERQGQVFKQQDADECFMGISQCLQNCTPYKNLEGEEGQLMKDLFQIEYEVTMKNTEIPDEKETISSDISNKLMCQIENSETPTNHMNDGLKSALEEKLEKLSDVDNQNHIYTKSSKIKKLPSYLAVQMQRFLWKGAVQEAQTEAGKVKILRAVSFPKVLDLYPLCTPELQKSLDYGREFEQKQKEEKEKVAKDRFDNWKKDQEEKGKMLPDDSKILWKMFSEDQKEADIKEHDDILYRTHGQGLDAGNYQLIAVLTHQGRSSDSGHYISWIHRSGDDWLKYDDDKVSEVKLADIMDLKGGGDWHMGYYFFYRKIELQ